MSICADGEDSEVLLILVGLPQKGGQNMNEKEMGRHWNWLTRKTWNRFIFRYFDWG